MDEKKPATDEAVAGLAGFSGSPDQSSEPAHKLQAARLQSKIAALQGRARGTDQPERRAIQRRLVELEEAICWAEREERGVGHE